MSNDSKHTPGPWKADFDETFSVRASDGRVAVVTHLNLVGRRDAEEAADNARLIAAAPDMLGALRAVVSEDYDTIKKLALAHAAIAKATGD